MMTTPIPNRSARVARVGWAMVASLLGGTCHAAITGTSTGIIAHPSSSITGYPPIGQSLSTSQGVAWNEQTGVLFNGTLDFWPALGNSQSVPASFPVQSWPATDSHYVYFDHSTFQGWGSTWIDFANPILGVLLTDQGLAATDPTHGLAGLVGPHTGASPLPPLPGSATPGFFNTWGGHEGWVWMSPSQPNRLYIELPFGPGGAPPIWSTDTVEMRVLTATPTPGALGLLGAAGLIAGRRRRVVRDALFGVASTVCSRMPAVERPHRHRKGRDDS